MANPKQTAVSWLVVQLLKESTGHISLDGLSAFADKALEMEKEQMDKVAGDWWNEGASYMHYGKREYSSFEQYYNETYGRE
jgi:hypothetical protein